MIKLGLVVTDPKNGGVNVPGQSAEINPRMLICIRET